MLDARLKGRRLVLGKLQDLFGDGGLFGLPRRRRRGKLLLRSLLPL